MTSLHPSDQHLITGSAIAPEVAHRRGYRTVTDPAELRALGFADYQARAGLLIPLYGVTGEQTLYQLRPYQPRTTTDPATGKRKSVKYETPAGALIQMDLHPLARPLLNDLKADLWITEGIRKGDAALSAGLCCLALLGVWSWRREGEPLPDWQHIPLQDRRVNLCFDSDVMTKPEVAKALSALCRFLQERGAAVWLCYLPDTEEGRKQGLDDFLAAGHTIGDLYALCQEELRPAAGGDRDESEPLYRLRKSEMGRQLRGLADVRPFGGLKLHLNLSRKDLLKASRVVTQFYGHIEDALKWDLLDLWVMARKGVPYGEQMTRKQQLFGRWAAQVGNWISAVGSFAVEPERRRPHLPFWLHKAVRDVSPEAQDTIFDTYEGSPMNQEQVAELLRRLMGETETPSEPTAKRSESAVGIDLGPWHRLAQIADEEFGTELLRLVREFGLDNAKAFALRYAEELRDAEQRIPWPEEITDESPVDDEASLMENDAENDDFEIEVFTAVKSEGPREPLESDRSTDPTEPPVVTPNHDSLWGRSSPAPLSNIGVKTDESDSLRAEAAGRGATVCRQCHHHPARPGLSLCQQCGTNAQRLLSGRPEEPVKNPFDD